MAGYDCAEGQASEPVNTGCQSPSCSASSTARSTRASARRGFNSSGIRAAIAASRSRVASTMRRSPPHMARSRRAPMSSSTWASVSSWSSPRRVSTAPACNRPHTVVAINGAIAPESRCVTAQWALFRDEAKMWAIDTGLSYKSARGRWVILATVLGSGMAFLDSTVVNIALPRIGTDLGIGLSGLQWTVNAYTLTLSGFLLLGGSLGDRYGRKRVFLIGVVWFAVASLLCAIA